MKFPEGRFRVYFLDLSLVFKNLFLPLYIRIMFAARGLEAPPDNMNHNPVKLGLTNWESSYCNDPKAPELYP